MTARTLMVVGTQSGAGKSTLVAALCRILARDGLRVAPFKAQNIALNAGVTPDGHEIGRATLVQAEAARIAPHPDMNPVLLKPEGARGSQVVLNGRAHGRIDAESWQALRPLLWETITGALDRLRARTDVVVIEGTGSPVELNLQRGDMANMSVARHADAPVLLVGDIERGGVFASLVGTLVLLDPADRARVRGLVINKLHGDPALLGNAVDLLRPHAFDLPTLGILPHLSQLGLPDEDVVGLDARAATAAAPHGAQVQLAIVRLPHIANFDDFEPLAAEAGVAVRYVERASELDDPPSAVIVPGSKVTLDDLAWLRRTGLAAAITRLARAGTPVVGICGGYQMLGRWLADPEGVEVAPGAQAPGLDLLPVRTVFERGKRTLRVEATVSALAGPLAALAGTTIRGYEIHMGRTSVEPGEPGASPLCSGQRGQSGGDDALGVVSADGRIWGTYLHGIFDNDDLRHAWLRSLGWQGRGRRLDREAAHDRLADHVAAHLDMAAVRRLVGLDRVV